jgi:phosphoglycolate phosphatase
MDRIPVDALFFDFDGTLGDTRQGICNAWKRTIAEANVECPDFDKIFRIGPPADLMAKLLFPNFSEAEQAEMARRYKANYDGSDMVGEEPFPWSGKLLNHFFSANKKIYVVTYKRMVSTLRLIKCYGFENYFSGVWGCDAIPGENMHKSELLKLAVRISGVAPEKCMMIGDTELDITAGHEAGVHTCAVSWGYGDPEKLMAARPELVVGKEDLDSFL